MFSFLQWPYGSYFNNVTGLTNYYNFDQPNYPPNPFEQYLNQPSVKSALNVDPSYVYSSGNNTVEVYLLEDWLKSVKPFVTTLLDNYRVLIYNGQNDIILSAPNCENFLKDLIWGGASDWHLAHRDVWYVDGEPDQPAGYVRQGGGLTYVVIRGAGHLVPQDQPKRAFDMITRFIEGEPF